MLTAADTRPSPAALVLAGAFPALCLHERYDPSLSAAIGSTSVSVALSDVAVLAIAVAAAVEWRRRPAPAWRNGTAIWVAAAALLALVAAATLWGPLVTDGYPLADKIVSASKFVEYALLAPAVVLIVRTRADALAATVSLAAVSAVAALVGVLQLVGAVGNLDDTPAGRRMPSFLGYHDFAAVSGVALGAALAWAVLSTPRGRELALVWSLAICGALGMVVAGAVATVSGLATGVVFACVVSWRRGSLTPARAAAAAAALAIVVAGTASMRSGDLTDFLGFLQDDDASGQVETYSQRALLTYIGYRIWLDSPVLGAGWQGSEVPAAFEPHLDDARARFPDVAEEAFPSREHPWGVQNAYVQAAADLGTAGLVALVALLAAGIVTAGTAAIARAGPAVVAGTGVVVGLTVCATTWAALGLVPGVPTTALVWLLSGAAVALPRA